jgi:hypothetical protein
VKPRVPRDVPTIVEFCKDPQLLGLTLSPAQETLLRATYGLPLDADQLELWRLCTGRATYSGRPFGEVTVVAGARSGKDSRIAGPVVCYEGVFGGHERRLAKGERGVIPLVAQDARATKVAFGYVRDYLMTSPALASMVAEGLANEVTLTNGVRIVCFPCTQGSLRSWSIPAAVMDEVAFFHFEGATNSDVEVQTSIRRGMVGFADTRLVKISTPYLKGGLLHEDFKRAFGQDDPDLLVWRAPTLLMNPSIRAARLERERRLDPLRFAREYEAEFAEDLEAFLAGAWVDTAVVPGRHALPPRADSWYAAAVDPMGGGQDTFTLSIVHLEAEGADLRIVQDLATGWSSRRTATVDLEGVVRECAALARQYGCEAVLGDHYAKQWVIQAFAREGIAYLPAPPKAEAYLEMEPVFAQGRIDLLDHPTLVRELKLLERQARPGGKVRVDHPHGGHDDHANALALAIYSATRTAVAASGAEDLMDPDVIAEEIRQLRAQNPALADLLRPAPWGGWDNLVVDDEAGWERGPEDWAWRRFDGQRWNRLW